MKLYRVAAVALLVPCAAFGSEQNAEMLCAYNVQASDGRFQIVPSETLRVLDRVSQSQSFILPSDAPENVVALMCARTSPIPVVGDALVLMAGYSLYISGPGKGNKSVLIKLSISDGAFRYEILGGGLSDRQLSDLTAVIDAMAETSKTEPATTPDPQS